MVTHNDESLPEGGDDVLPPELAHNFETLRALLAIPEDSMKAKREEATIHSPKDVKRRKQAEELALATALVVEREVAFLQNGIGELEAILAAAAAQQDLSGQPESGNRRRVFPALPPLIPDDECEVENDCFELTSKKEDGEDCLGLVKNGKGSYFSIE